MTDSTYTVEMSVSPDLACADLRTASTALIARQINGRRIIGYALALTHNDGRLHDGRLRYDGDGNLIDGVNILLAVLLTQTTCRLQAEHGCPAPEDLRPLLDGPTLADLLNGTTTTEDIP